MIWVYAICERGGPPHPRLRGRAQAPLEEIAHGRLTAVCSCALGDEPREHALQAHAAVVDALMAQRTVLPARFATRFAGALAVRATLAVQRARLLSALRRVEGCVEFAVRAVEPEGVVAEAADGRAYVQARLRAQRTAAALQEPLARLAVETRQRPSLVRGELFRAAYLIDRGTLPEFQDAVERVRREHPCAGLMCTGPWPPYSFAEDARDEPN